MPTDHIISLLILERDKLNRAIEALRAGGTETGKPKPSSVAPAPVAKKRVLSAATRRKMAAGQKRRWAAKAAGK